VAQEKATEMKNKIKEEGLAHCARVEQEAAAEYKSDMEAISEHAGRLTQKKRAEAEREAELLAERARTHMEEAVKTIVWGIIEKCQ
jgi:hypothetical protein